MAKSRNWISIILKVAVSVAALGYIIFRINQIKTAEGIEISTLDILFDFRNFSLPLLLLSTLLLIPNIGIEAFKWKFLLRHYYPELSYSTAVKAILAGFTTGIFTPNRVGEYAGRILYLPEGHRPEAITLTFLDRISQMLVTLLAGTLAISIIHFQNLIPENAEFVSSFWVILILGIFISLIFLLLLFPKKVGNILEKTPLVKWKLAADILRPLSAVSSKELIRVFILSAFRYAVFSSQYLLLLFAFGFEQHIFLGYGMITLVFLAKSLVPFVGLSELGVRESAAIEFMGWFGVGVLTAFYSTIILYFINVIVPALLGIGFVNGLHLQTKKVQS